MPFLPLDQLPAQPVHWLWPGRLPFGYLAILDGDPGLGKSLLTLDLAARITTGRPFPDNAPSGEPKPVILVNAEDGVRDTLRVRLAAAGADLSRVHAFERSPTEAPLRLPNQLRRLEDAIIRSGARYVVLDPIMSFLDATVNVASDPGVRAALAPLADLAARHRCVIQMVRHLNKGAGKNPLYRGLYSIGFVASCRVGWFVTRDPCLGRLVLAQPKTNLDPPQPSLNYAIESDADGHARISWHGVSTCPERDLFSAAPSRQSLRLRAQEWLLNFLKDGPRHTRDIWNAVKPFPFSIRTLQRARQRLEIGCYRVHPGTIHQTTYWLLPGQNLTAEHGLDEGNLALATLITNVDRQVPNHSPLDSNFA